MESWSNTPAKCAKGKQTTRTTMKTRMGRRRRGRSPLTWIPERVTKAHRDIDILPRMTQPSWKRRVPPRGSRRNRKRAVRSRDKIEQRDGLHARARARSLAVAKEPSSSGSELPAACLLFSSAYCSGQTLVYTVANVPTESPDRMRATLLVTFRSNETRACADVCYVY